MMWCSCSGKTEACIRQGVHKSVSLDAWNHLEGSSRFWNSMPSQKGGDNGGTRNEKEGILQLREEGCGNENRGASHREPICEVRL